MELYVLLCSNMLHHLSTPPAHSFLSRVGGVIRRCFSTNPNNGAKTNCIECPKKLDLAWALTSECWQWVRFLFESWFGSKAPSLILGSIQYGSKFCQGKGLSGVEPRSRHCCIPLSAGVRNCGW